MTTSRGCEVTIAGFVQGQGIRPALARLAAAQQWTGRVRNTSHGVLLSLAGVTCDNAELEQQLRGAHPGLSTARILMRRCDVDVGAGFVIDESLLAVPPAVPVPRDAAICADCLRDFHEDRNRRQHYGLISCPQCGPRFSISTALPFDRVRTTLADFPPCQDCQHEYRDPLNRRQHAQTIGCPACGPRVWATDRAARTIARDDGACRVAATAIARGEIIALRGFGGYQLLADATNSVAIARLRQRKQRPTKPFAVLVRSLAEADRYGLLGAAAKSELESPANPIVLVPRRPGSILADEVHPHRTEVGLLLPTTAVHDRLLELVGVPVVCTSANRDGEPLVVELDTAQSELAGIADLWLHHDRPIANPIDDSVVRIVAGRPVTLRLARGLAPLPLDIGAIPPRIALGSDQKAAMALSNGQQAVLGPYVGNLSDLGARGRFSQTIASLQRLYAVTSCEWLADAHPDDTARLVLPSPVRPNRVWHHHAHLLAGMIEHGWLDRTVLGIAADGQGYGPDGRLWGGEVLAVNRRGFRRLASVRPFALPGGEHATRDPVRVAISLLSQLPDVPWSRILAEFGLSVNDLQRMQSALRVRLTPWTSSLGRLLDGIGCLVLGGDPGGEIGEAAIRLESLCDPRAEGCYDWAIHETEEPWSLDWRPMLQAVLHDRSRAVPPSVIAERVHRGVAAWILTIQRRWSAWPVVLGGGVFQNRRLCELLVERWPAAGAPLGLPGRIPCNDGGLAAGQIAFGE